MYTYEISVVYDTHERTVLFRGLSMEEAEEAFVLCARECGPRWYRPEYSSSEKRALARLRDTLKAEDERGLRKSNRQPALLVTREDQTPEARRQKWEDDFYDLDRRGYKRRRYKKSQTERDWEKYHADQKKLAALERGLKKARSTECKDCGARWSELAYDEGLVHVCGTGLTKGQR